MEQFDFSVYVIASKSKRFANYIIDLIVIYALMVMFFIAVAFFATLAGNDGIINWMSNVTALQSYVIGGIFITGYYSIMESLCSRTVSKFITGTMVVMEDGSVPDSATILKRSFCRLIPFEHFSFFGDRGWHDSITRTYVVEKAAFELEKHEFEQKQIRNEETTEKSEVTI